MASLLIILILAVSATPLLVLCPTLHPVFLRSQAPGAHFPSRRPSQRLAICTGKCERCVGLTLILLSLICIVANALLLVPDGKTTWTNYLSLQVWLMAGFIGGGLMVLCPGIAEVRAAGKGCCAGCCGNCCRMLNSVFAAFGMLGAIYCLSVSAAGLRIGPKCLIDGRWDYHFQNTQGAYLHNPTQWNLCEEPPHVVPWNVTLFSLPVAASSLEILLC